MPLLRKGLIEFEADSNGAGGIIARIYSDKHDALRAAAHLSFIPS